MKRKWLSLIALVMVAVMCTPVIALGGTNIFYVDTANKKSLNMRSDCTMGDNIIASIPYRAEVTVYEFLAGDAWARVEYNGPVSYTHLDVYKRQTLPRARRSALSRTQQVLKMTRSASRRSAASAMPLPESCV